MIYEFAVSPGLFTSEDRITFLYEAFGSEQGRIVSEFPPKRWAAITRAVIDQSAGNPDERKRWIDALMAILKSASYRRQGAVYDDGRSWIENAVAEHQRRPFRGILHIERSADRAVIRFGTEMKQHPAWSCSSSCHRVRKAHVMIDAVAPLLDMSTMLVLVDPYFWAADADWLNVLLALADYLADSVVQPKIRHIHYIIRSERKMTEADTEKEFRNLIESALPRSISVRFHIVLPALLHDRFVLTDRGGVQFGKGLDEGSGEVLITRLGDSAYYTEWAKALDIRSGSNRGRQHHFEVSGQV